MDADFFGTQRQKTEGGSIGTQRDCSKSREPILLDQQRAKAGGEVRQSRDAGRGENDLAALVEMGSISI